MIMKNDQVPLTGFEILCTGYLNIAQDDLSEHCTGQLAGPHTCTMRGYYELLQASFCC